MEEQHCNCKSFNHIGIGIGVVKYNYTAIETNLKIYAIGDIHGGEDAVNKAELKMKEAVGTGARIVLTGDLLNYAMKDSVSFYHGAESPQVETERITALISKYAKNIDGVVSGNHDQRAFKYSGLDTLKSICLTNNIAYHSNCLLLVYRVGAASGCRQHRNDKGPLIYKIFLTHSSRGGRKVGSKLAKIVDMNEIVESDVYLSGHSHDLSSHRGSKIYASNKGILRKKDQVYVNCGSFQSYQGYAVAKNLPPAPTGCAILELNCSKFEVKMNV